MPRPSRMEIATGSLPHWMAVSTPQEPPEESPEQIEVAIVCPEAQRAGVWANFANVSHSPYEFSLDFARLDFDGARPVSGVIVQRVAMSPLFIVQLIEALKKNYDDWAEKALPPEARQQ